MRLAFKKEWFLIKSFCTDEYLYDVRLTNDLVKSLKEKKPDIFTFVHRTFLGSTEPTFSTCEAKKEIDDVALLEVDSYDEWWRKIGKKTRNMIRKAEKSGVTVRVVEVITEDIIKGIWKIYNETPFRQDRYFPHYGISYNEIKRGLSNRADSDLFCALYKNQVIGFSTLEYGDRVCIISQILSLTAHFDKAPNNALLAKMVERAVQKNYHYVIYARMGKYHETLSKFKRNHGFNAYYLPRYYLPITKRGAVAIKLNLHRPLKDTIPEKIGKPLLPFINTLSKHLRMPL